MSAKTRQKLIQVIAEHYLGDGTGKLRVQDTAKAVGITRQAFTKTYSDLTPYIKGEKLIEHLLVDDGSESSHDLLKKSQRRVRELKDEVEILKNKYVSDLDKVTNSYITTLMNRDITMKESNEIRVTLEKQSLQNDVLVRRNKELEHELTHVKARQISFDDNVNVTRETGTEIIQIEPALDMVFKNYHQTDDMEVFEDEKDAAIEHALKKLNKFCHADGAEVVIFVERYLSSFKNFLTNYQTTDAGLAIIIRLPLFTRAELNIFVGNIKPHRSVKVYVPYCDSETTCKAQRKFLFREIPEIEIQAADNMAIPSIVDGFDCVTVFRIHQGE